MAKKKETDKTTIPMSKSEDGTIKFTFTISWKELKNTQRRVAESMKGNIEVPGFRKGKAPLQKVIQHIPDDTLTERALQQILPQYFEKAIRQHKVQPAIYPKFSLIKAQEGEDWQIEAKTTEVPEVKLGEYKKEIKGAATAKNIWTPEKGIDKKPKENKEPSRQEKEQIVLEAITKIANVKIPQMLIDQEVDTKLSALLGRIENLGLSLESYLASTGKNAQTLRQEYQKQAEQTLKLELILNKIAQEEKVEASEEEMDEFIKAAQADPNIGDRLKDPAQKQIVASILRKRKVLDNLVSLV